MQRTIGFLLRLLILLRLLGPGSAHPIDEWEDYVSELDGAGLGQYLLTWKVACYVFSNSELERILFEL